MDILYSFIFAWDGVWLLVRVYHGKIYIKYYKVSLLHIIIIVYPRYSEIKEVKKKPC